MTTTDQAAILAHRAYVAAVLADPRPGETPAPFDEWHATTNRATAHNERGNHA